MCLAFITSTTAKLSALSPCNPEHACLPKPPEPALWLRLTSLPLYSTMITDPHQAPHLKCPEASVYR